ncbi:MAG: putative rane protein [Marmoricola sp.]|nr:putative rane protein [Marmoricola sp.]
MSGLLDNLLNVDPVWLFSIAGLLVFLEDAIFIGFLIPGETAAVLSGVGANIQHIALVIPVLIIVIAAIAGDSVGYEVGKKFFGPKILTSRFLVKHQVRIGRAQDFLQRRGGGAVFLGRFTAFFRAMMPALAGAAGMHYRKFLLWNAAGGIVWGTAFVSLGFLAGASYKKVEHQAGRGVAIGLAAIVVVAAVAWKIRSERTPEEDSA